MVAGRTGTTTGSPSMVVTGSSSGLLMITPPAPETNFRASRDRPNRRFFFEAGATKAGATFFESDI